ncbi:hypothetical protein DK104_19605 [Salmonella enterica subsp. enterica serovar Lexington]|uniref:hypothetical protein n=1 Tax=Salmonella enterica TaxID=28901 RepID=UPI000FBE0787|nr:hypothetical protein [Salmonella enterica subsp. enterica serovar Weltevreden]EAC0964180.1 hypothetical protein [Salmonella enterica subsp. enterica serovar Newport]EAN5797468.1 hypothetical protein [Salmonella enterica]EBR9008010.1 hypothetical protein [Salmonella enterica subsp. enterica serovar Richmond]EBU7427007.1 hypothetical protein [Salmonella enterica subsp. enterica serovar Lexington]EBX4401877.1 hypothetical protein [Salmonella enterica subsp. enterica serovar Typhimurium]ECG574
MRRELVLAFWSVFTLLTMTVGSREAQAEKVADGSITFSGVIEGGHETCTLQNPALTKDLGTRSSRNFFIHEGRMPQFEFTGCGANGARFNMTLVFDVDPNVPGGAYNEYVKNHGTARDIRTFIDADDDMYHACINMGQTEAMVSGKTWACHFDSDSGKIGVIYTLLSSDNRDVIPGTINLLTSFIFSFD